MIAMKLSAFGTHCIIMRAHTYIQRHKYLYIFENKEGYKALPEGQFNLNWTQFVI